MDYLLAAANALDVVAASLPAAITAAGAVWASGRKSRKKLDQVAESVSTSNGKTAGQLVESVARDLSRLSAGQNAIQQQLAEHTVQDSANFAALEARLARVDIDKESLKGLELQLLDLDKTVRDLKETT